MGYLLLRSTCGTWFDEILVLKIVEEGPANEFLGLQEVERGS